MPNLREADNGEEFTRALITGRAGFIVVVGDSCVVFWWREVHGGEPPPQWGRYRAAVTAGLRAADLVISPSQAMLAALEHA